MAGIGDKKGLEDGGGAVLDGDGRVVIARDLLLSCNTHNWNGIEAPPQLLCERPRHISFMRNA